MKNFVVIDHSIKRIGGHNYEYALHILAAAKQQGYQPILAVNRRFFERQRLPASWQLYTPFRHTTYEAARLAGKQLQIDPEGKLCAGGTSRLSLPVEKRGSPSWMRLLPVRLRRALVRRHENNRRRIIDHYGEDIASLFGQLPLACGDHVFVPTLSEDDLVGLLAFFHCHKPSASLVTWHLQFHFSVYEGREPSCAEHADRLVGLRQIFCQAASALPTDRVRFYTTTEILAEQFNRLGAATFQTLPYPVNPLLIERSPRTYTPNGALRVTCAGGVRPEKGTAALDQVVAPLWREYFDTGRLQLVVQAKRLGKLPRQLRRHARYDGQPHPAPTQQATPKVAVARWPLSTEKYLDLIRSSDIGLLLYDAQQYYARCSGVMVEMLKAGVPVIVPAGCWMADQIAEPIFAHRDRLCQQMSVVARLTPADADWEAGRAQRYYLWRSDARLLVGGDAGCPKTRLFVPPSASHLCVRFRWAASSMRGAYLQLSASSSHEVHHDAVSLREVVGQRTTDAPLPILLPISPGAREVQLIWQNAFGQHMLELEDVDFVFLASGDTPCPLGSVGLVSAGLDQAPRLLRDMAEHYAHYRRAAERFAPGWGQRHSPEKVVRLLTDDLAGARRQAA
jgi:hypothetical protein